MYKGTQNLIFFVEPTSTTPSVRVASNFSVSTRRGEEVVAVATTTELQRRGTKKLPQPSGIWPIFKKSASLLFRVPSRYAFIVVPCFFENWLISRTKVLLRWVLAFVAIMVFGAAPVALGAEAIISDLGVETPGMLPSNPFYFFKEWGRGIRKSLSFTELKKAELQLDILNEQIAEIKKLVELAPHRRDALMHALNNYTEGAGILSTKLTALKSLRGTVGVEKLIDLLLQRSLKHYVLLNSLFGALDGALDSATENAMRILVSSNIVIPGNLDDTRHWINRLQYAVKNQQSNHREWNAAGFIAYLETKANAELMIELMRLRDRLLTAWTGKLQSVEDMSIVESGNLLVNFELLDEAREHTADHAVRNAMTIKRQALIEVLKSRGILSAGFVAQIIQTSEEWVLNVEHAQKNASLEARTIVGPIIERARFTEESAKKFFKEESLVNAYSQAMMAKAAARHSGIRLLEKSIDYSTELENIKQYFDSLTMRAKAKANTQIIVEKAQSTRALKDLETQIARLADVIADNGNRTKITNMIRDINIALGALDAMIGE